MGLVRGWPLILSCQHVSGIGGVHGATGVEHEKLHSPFVSWNICHFLSFDAGNCVSNFQRQMREKYCVVNKSVSIYLEFLLVILIYILFGFTPAMRRYTRPRTGGVKHVLVSGGRTYQGGLREDHNYMEDNKISGEIWSHALLNNNHQVIFGGNDGTSFQLDIENVIHIIYFENIFSFFKNITSLSLFFCEFVI